MVVTLCWQDELVTTKKSYDAQLMTMSEALASMNGNLASQQDEIEELKMQLRVSKDFRFQFHNFYY